MVTIEPRNGITAQESSGAEFRPTRPIQRVSRVMENAPDGMTKSEAAVAAGGNKHSTSSSRRASLTVHGKKGKGSGRHDWRCGGYVAPVSVIWRPGLSSPGGR
jgi:hypothetical protein